MALNRKAIQKKLQRIRAKQKRAGVQNTADAIRHTATEDLKRFLDAGLKSLEKDALSRLWFFCEIGGRFNFHIVKEKGGYKCAINVTRESKLIVPPPPTPAKKKS